MKSLAKLSASSSTTGSTDLSAGRSKLRAGWRLWRRDLFRATGDEPCFYDVLGHGRTVASYPLEQDACPHFAQTARVLRDHRDPGPQAVEEREVVETYQGHAMLAPEIRESLEGVFLVGFITSEGLYWAKLAAAASLASLPVVLLGWIAQKQLVRGLALGAVK